MKHAKQIALLVTILCTLLVGSTAGSYAQDTAGAQTIYLPLVVNTGEAGAAMTAPPAGEPIPGQYIVVLRDDLVSSASVAATAADMATAYGGETLHRYDAAINGFAIKFSLERSANALDGLRQDPRVELMEQDTIVSLADSDAVDTTQTSATWGLDRIDQRSLPLPSTFTYTRTGAGVRVYILDTGIRITHSQFGGRASYGYDAANGTLSADDCQGHGTHVAGIIGGSTYGVAKGVNLIAARVFSCGGFGSASAVIDGISWVTKQKLANPSMPMVANMSLGGSASSIMDAVVQRSINVGVTYVIAAGNSNANACAISPARVGAALTLGATTNTDNRASYSNWGTCLDLFAPGSNIKSAWYTGDAATVTISGTSMAAPHVAGVAALYLQGNPSAAPASVANALAANATSGVVIGAGTGSPNRLLFTNY